MSLEYIITIEYKRSPLEGIINEIKKHYSDPISSNVIIPDSSYKDTYKLVTWEAYTSYNTSFDKGFVSFRFPGRFLFPTHYTLRGYSSYWYQKKWKVYGYNSGEENDNKTWTLLGEHESTADTFCGNEVTCSSSTKTSTFPLKSTNKGFEYIRFQTFEDSLGSNSYHFITSATEFFGTLSTNNYLPSNKKVSIYRKCTPRDFLTFVLYLSAVIMTK